MNKESIDQLIKQIEAVAAQSDLLIDATQDAETTVVSEDASHARQKLIDLANDLKTTQAWEAGAAAVLALFRQNPDVLAFDLCVDQSTQGDDQGNFWSTTPHSVSNVRRNADVVCRHEERLEGQMSNLPYVLAATHFFEQPLAALVTTNDSVAEVRMRLERANFERWIDAKVPIKASEMLPRLKAGVFRD